jgi:hypothetical protein
MMIFYMWSAWLQIGEVSLLLLYFPSSSYCRDKTYSSTISRHETATKRLGFSERIDFTTHQTMIHQSI